MVLSVEILYKMNAKIRIGIVQLNILWEDKKANIEKVIEFSKKAAEEGVDVLFFPEMSFTGFSMNTEKTHEDREIVFDRMLKIFKETNVSIGFGWVEKAENCYKQDMPECNFLCNNHYSVISGGGIISDYIKIHPFSYSGEDKLFESGDKITKYNLLGIPFSSVICYDLRFPELFQILSRYAHIIVVPACWPEKRKSHWITLLKARAIENQSYVVGVNCVGNIGGLEYSGNSMIINPDGEIVAEAKEYEESLVIYELEDDVSIYRNSFPIKLDRKENLYKELQK